MKDTLLVKKLSNTTGRAVDIPSIFKAEGVEYQSVGVGNWADKYPYHPSVQFAIAHDGDNTYLHYKVEENCVRAVEENDLGHVWEDSCCEYFSMIDEEGGYYNLETNCIGTVLLCNGKGRNDRQQAKDSVLARIDRWASLGTRSFGCQEGSYSWELALVVPKESYFKHKLPTLSGLEIKANFYKCGDKTLQPHFLSWKKVDVENPDFHRPDFFGTLKFEE